MDLLHIIFVSAFSITSFFVYLSKNPIYSILFLILSFVYAAAILMLFKLEFLGFLFLIIYVGAVAVLFLFVIMMLESKMLDINWFLQVLIFSFLFIFIGLQIFLNYSNMVCNSIFVYSFNSFQLDPIENLKIFGEILYNFYLDSVIIAGLVLLVAVLGCTTLTLKAGRERNISALK